jgi:hypothetical protein
MNASTWRHQPDLAAFSLVRRAVTYETLRWPAAASSAAEQRRSPRIEIFGRLHGHLVALDVPVRVTGISLGGVSFESPVDFPPGAVHEFRLAASDAASFRLKGRIVHCRPVFDEEEGDPRFAAGAEFLGDDAEAVADAIRDLVERIRVS